MRRFISARYNAGTFNTALLLLRLGFGILLVHHGYQKFENFHQTEGYMMNFMGIGKSASAALVVFAELICSVLVVIGLFTRFACVPIIIMFLVIIFKATNADFFGKSELPVAYLTGFLTIFLMGPGRISVDSMIAK